MSSMEQTVKAITNHAEVLNFLKFTYLHEQVASLSIVTSVPTDQIRYLVCLFGAYPLAMIYKNLPTAKLRHVFDICIGVSIAQFVFRTAWIHSFVLSTCTYLIIKHGPTKYAPYVGFSFNLIYLSLAHLYRLYVDYMGWTLDFTGLLMLLVIKMSSFGFNYYDGLVPSQTKGRSSLEERVLADRQRFALTKLPSLLEFYGYVYNFPTLLAGPTFELHYYLEVVQDKVYQNEKLTKRPSSSLAAASKCMTGIFFMGIFAHFGPHFPSSDVYSPIIAALPIFTKIRHVLICVFILKSKYYSVWKIAEGATVMCGFGFEGFDPEGRPKGWNGVSNLDIFAFEKAQSIRDATRAWNKGTQLWLERYVYWRTNRSLLATYFVSAFWHGFYPGYYMAFFTLPIATVLNRLARRRVRPYFLESRWKKVMYDMLSFVGTQAIGHYCMLPFFSLSIENGLAAWQSFHFAGHFIALGIYIVFSLVPSEDIRKQKDL